MVSNKVHIDFILEYSSELESIGYKAMMRECTLYYRDKIVSEIDS